MSVYKIAIVYLGWVDFIFSNAVLSEDSIKTKNTKCFFTRPVQLVLEEIICHIMPQTPDAYYCDIWNPYSRDWSPANCHMYASLFDSVAVCLESYVWNG